jgi:oligopeptide/dipeptide ABC transporter ATP-binding protein
MKREDKPLVAEVDDLRIVYEGSHSLVHAVSGASISVAEGETVGIVGESGSGKSTIARTLIGLLDKRTARITGGRIVLDGQDVTGFTPREWEKVRGNPAAMVFQDPLSYLNPVLTVGRQIAESVRLHDRTAPVEARVAELLEMVKLPASVAKAYPDELSGGMRQRCLLAIALGCRPKLLIADEPTTALDVTTQAEIGELLRDLQSSLGMALLLISHDLGLVTSLCERIYVMYAGRTIEWGPGESVFGSPRHPYTSGLLAAAEGRRTVDDRFMTVQGDVPNLGTFIPGCPFEPRCALAVAKCGVMPEARPVAAHGGHFVRCHSADTGSNLEARHVSGTHA